MLFENIIVGPIHSRRLGTSLGVNVLPTQKKYCSFDCVYCECGWNEIDTRTHIGFNDKEKIKESLLYWCENHSQQEREKVDSITFSGNGEPTLHPDILAIVQDVIELRDKYLPQTKVTILTNSTNLYREDVRKALHLIDNPILKLDAGTEETYKRINKPVSAKFSDIVGYLKEFGNKAIIQTILLRSKNKAEEINNTTPQEFNAWLSIVEEIKPRLVMLYVIDRATPDPDLIRLEKQEMEQFADKVRELGIEAECY
ncbi:MAG: radical SAM protein [Bacteroidales bacterium]|nr:radical SAM protein [Bacteroidales bacterium]